jgi:uncharacterized protein (TIGR00288 family)
MAETRIAVLFDAENINCETAQRVLAALATRGLVQIRKAIGDFSAANLARWIACCTDSGIELVMQPALGKGKNSADIRLTIEAMDIAHRGHVDTVALVTRDRDFAPLAQRLRDAGLVVLGFAESEPNVAFREACSRFEVIGALETAAKPAPKPVAKPGFAKSELQRLRKVIDQTCAAAPVASSTLAAAMRQAEPALHAALGGQGKFQKTLVALGLVEIVGSGATQRLQPAAKKQAA